MESEILWTSKVISTNQPTLIKADFCTRSSVGEKTAARVVICIM
jgi:hypothetical protein